MRTLVIPDVHLKLEKLQEILKRFESSFDEVVFLGDFLDDWEDPYNRRLENMLVWLKEKIYNDKYVFLMGNHEVHYFSPNYYGNKEICGFTRQKQKIVEKYLDFDEFCERFKITHVIPDTNYLLSHAGLSNDMFGESLFLADTRKLLLEKHPLIMPGMDRGFYSQDLGGVLWRDWSSLEEYFSALGSTEIPCTQIVGHTPGKSVRYRPIANAFCIDTDLHHVLGIDEREFRFFEV